MSLDIHPNNTRAPAASAGHHAPRSRDLLRLLFTLVVITGFVLLPFGHSVIAGKGGTVKLGPSRPLAPQQTAAPTAATEPTSQPAPDNVVVTPTPRQSQQLPIELNASAAGGVYRNPYRVLQHSARPCRGGAHTRGSWVHDPSLKPLYPSVGEILGSCQRGHEAVHGRGSVRPELLYKWVPDTCDLVEWSEAGFCKALRGRDIMFAGDSLNDHWHAALIYRLGLHNKDIYKREGTVAGKQSCRSHPICGRYYAKPLRVYFLTNQLLREISKRNVNHKWWKFINQYQVLVLNAGSWMRDPHDETREVDDDEWRGHMDFALKLVQRQRFNGTIIWRTTYQGHPYCWNYKEPLTEELTEEDFPTVPPYKRYRWGAIPGRNNYSTSLWQRAGAHILDITRPTNLMPMGHLGQNHPKFKLRNTTDCLHYCAPGPYDLWSQLLMNLLMGNIDT